MINLQVLFYVLIFSFSFKSLDYKNDEDLKIFNSKRIYIYEAKFIDNNDKVVSTNGVTLIPLGQPWKWDKSQTSFKVDYNYSSKDSIAFLSYVNPKTKNIKKPKRYIWYKSIVTGAVENDSTVWMHPFRDNQYEHTEVAPFPTIMKSSLKIGSEWKNALNVMLGYGNFKGKVISTYQVIKKEDKVYGKMTLKDCWLIKAIGEHDKLGKSYLNFYFHPEYGFVEMNYLFYDGVKINFILKDIIIEK